MTTWFVCLLFLSIASSPRLVDKSLNVSRGDSVPTLFRILPRFPQDCWPARLLLSPLQSHLGSRSQQPAVRARAPPQLDYLTAADHWRLIYKSNIDRELIGFFKVLGFVFDLCWTRKRRPHHLRVDWAIFMINNFRISHLRTILPIRSQNLHWPRG